MNTKNFLLFILLLPFGLSWAEEDHLSIYELDDYVVQSSPLQLTESEKTQSVSVIEKRELNDLRSETIAQTLALKPGISQTFYGPNANRSIIRGLDGFRVTTLENGISAFDLSATSADHAVSLNPLMLDRIEILRGSASLIYGSNAIGGVVNVFDHSIPNFYQNDDTFQNDFRTRFSSVNDGRYYGGIFYQQSGNFVFQFNGSKVKTSDYKTPSFEVHHDDHDDNDGGDDAEEEEFADSVVNSHSEIDTFGFGGSYTHENGYIGLSYSNYSSDYGVPNHEQSVVSIDREKTTLKGVYDFDSAYFDRVDFQLAYGDYSHEEAPGEEEGHDEHDHHAQFLYEGIDSQFIFTKQSDSASSALSLSFTDSDMKIDGDESYLAAMEHNAANNTENDELGTLAESTNPRINNDSAKRLGIGFMHKEKISDSVSLNGGIRYENISRDYDAVTRVEEGETPVATDVDRDDSTLNGSVGFVIKKSDSLTFSGNLHYSERIPETSELFSSGAHHATESFEIGNQDLENEESVGVEFALSNNQGALSQKASIYYNQYDNFIFQSDTGFVTGEHDDDHGDDDGDDHPEEAFEELTIRQYLGAEANIYGFEYEFDYQLTVNTYVSGFADYIRGKNKTEDSDLPRIPPWRIGLGYYTEYEDYRFNLNATYYGKQDDVVGSNEEATDSYTLFNARLGYYIQKDQASELYLKVNNLTDQLGYVHTSFLKESAPIPGRNIEVGFSTRF